MSLSKEPVFSELKNHFVCGYRDISNEPYSGNSGAHSVGGQAVDTTNGAGPHNIQLFVLDPDGTVLHCLPGYWNPEDLAAELKLAQRIDTIWQDKALNAEQKKMQFARIQLDHFRSHSKETIARSQMQGFDKHHELMKGKNADTVRLASAASCSGPSCAREEMAGEGAKKGEDGEKEELVVKSTDEIMHERMAKRAFVAYTSFDTGKFSDYGTHFYDKHEDALDDQGRLTTEPGEGPPKSDTMRDVISRRRPARQNVRPSAASASACVRTYGQLRSNR